MRHPAQIERWRKLTASERFDEFVALMEMNHRLHCALPPEERRRRNQLLIDRHDRDEGHRARVPAADGRLGEEESR